jgi:hypothetical protein
MTLPKKYELVFERGLSLAILILIVVGFFWPLIFAGHWIPHGGGDLVSFLWPMYCFSARSLQRGEVPLWNPHLYSGAPFVADNQSSVFYPINLLAFALFGEPSYKVMEGLVVFHIWLAGANMFILLQGLGLKRPAAVFGGVAFALSDLFITHIGNLNLNATMAWAPLLLLLTHRALTGENGRAISWAAGAGAVLGIAALAGHGQMLLLMGLALAGYVAYRLIIEGLSSKWRSTSAKQQWKRLLTVCLLAILIVMIGIGGAALTLLPAREMTEHTGRSRLPYDEATVYSLPPKALTGLLTPDFYGRSATGFWGDWDRVEVGYTGVATLVLAAAGTYHWIKTRQRFPGGFFLLLIAGGLALAMGKHTPLYRLLYRYVPVFDQVRVPARLIVLADFGLAALAAYGLDQLLRKPSRAATWIGLGAVAAGAILLAPGLHQAKAVPPERVTQATTSIVIAAILLASSGVMVWLVRRHRWVAWLLVGLLATDLIYLGSMLEIEPNDPTLGFQHEDVVDFLRQDANLYRIESISGAWQPDAALTHGLYDIGGVFNPLGLAPYHAYLAVAKGERGAPLYNLLGAKYVLAPKDKAPGGERLVSVYTENPQIDIYLNTTSLPMALLVHEAKVVESHTAAWEALFESFDPTQTVILEKSQAVRLNPEGEQPSEPSGGTIEFVRYESNEIVLAVETPANGWLVLSEVYYPGWRATVDGQAVKVLRADYTFRAVALSPGEHIVKMTFAPWTWRVGLAVSATTWIGLATWAMWKIKRRIGKRRQRDDLPPHQPMV